MADDRPVEDPTEQLVRVTDELKDLRETVLARLATRPTGDIEPSIRTIAKSGTLLCTGQVVLRASYPVLWQFAQDQSLVGTWFTSGDGSTTFGIPDFRGRVFVGVGTLGSDTYTGGGTGGASTKTLSLANMPNHDHNVSVNGVGDHQHARGGGNHFTNFVGDHGGHTDAPNSTPAFASGGGSLPTFYNQGRGGHNHTVDPGDFTGGHGHSVNESGMGSGSSFDVRQAFIGGNWLIYT